MKLNTFLDTQLSLKASAEAMNSQYLLKSTSLRPIVQKQVFFKLPKIMAEPRFLIISPERQNIIAKRKFIKNTPTYSIFKII